MVSSPRSVPGVLLVLVVLVALSAAAVAAPSHVTPPPEKFGERGIFGKVFSIEKLSGVTVEITGPVSVSTPVSPNGYWGHASTSFPAGTYSVRAVGSGLNLEPASVTVVVWATPAGDYVINVAFSLISLGETPVPLPPLPDPGYESPEDDLLVVEKLRVSSKKWKLTATLRPGRGRDVDPSAGLDVFLDGLGTLAVPAGTGFESRGSSGLKFVHRSEGLKVTLRLRAVDVRIKVKAKDPEMIERLIAAFDGSGRTVSVLAGEFAASARK